MCTRVIIHAHAILWSGSSTIEFNGHILSSKARECESRSVVASCSWVISNGEFTILQCSIEAISILTTDSSSDVTNQVFTTNVYSSSYRSANYSAKCFNCCRINGDNGSFAILKSKCGLWKVALIFIIISTRSINYSTSDICIFIICITIGTSSNNFGLNNKILATISI